MREYGSTNGNIEKYREGLPNSAANTPVSKKKKRETLIFA